MLPTTVPAADLAVGLDDIRAARDRIGGILEPTPLPYSSYFTARWGAPIWFKLENLQMTGSFKERGALNKLLLLTPDERSRGVITASAGNHGQGVAWHARRLAIPATIVMPLNTPLIKVSNTQNAGARVVLHGGNFDEASEHARHLQADQGLVYVHGFDDPAIVAGQGTLGLEILEQCPQLDTVVVPVGGGGLAAGVALAVKELRPEARVVGVQFEKIASMRAALKAGEPVTLPPERTIADGIAVRLAGRLPFDVIRRHVDELITVSEDEIANAILLMLERDKTVVEGAGAVGVAAIENGHLDLKGGKTVVVLSGGNIDVNLLSRIIEKGLVKEGRMARLRVTVPDYPGQLARILDVVAEGRANILEVHHSRAFSKAPVGETAIDLVLETRGPDHVETILTALIAKGFHAEKLAF